MDIQRSHSDIKRSHTDIKRPHIDLKRPLMDLIRCHMDRGLSSAEKIARQNYATFGANFGISKNRHTAIFKSFFQ